MRCARATACASTCSARADSAAAAASRHAAAAPAAQAGPWPTGGSRTAASASARGGAQQPRQQASCLPRVRCQYCSGDRDARRWPHCLLAGGAALQPFRAAPRRERQTVRTSGRRRGALPAVLARALAHASAGPRGGAGSGRRLRFHLVHRPPLHRHQRLRQGAYAAQRRKHQLCAGRQRGPRGGRAACRCASHAQLVGCKRSSGEHSPQARPHIAAHPRLQEAASTSAVRPDLRWISCADRRARRRPCRRLR
jgi:hypothetical protein